MQSSALLLSGITFLYLLTACNKDRSEREYVMVTLQGGYIVSTTAPGPGLIKITPGGSYKATSTGNNLAFTPLTATQHDSLKRYLTAFPRNTLRNYEEKELTCLGCDDNRYWALEYKELNVGPRKWFVDQNPNQEEVRIYLQQLYQTLKTNGIW